MAYYVLANCKKRIGGQANTTTNYDPEIDSYGAKADAEVNDEIYEIASKNRRITTLPVLPLASTADNYTKIQEAANDRVLAFWYRDKAQRPELFESYMKSSKQAIKDWVARQEVDATIYGKIV